ncbi:MAG: Gmad2 immunoglobulin-like domain-containing protein [Dermatophilaceae bacterium]|nr:GerMN domain-containing protein [Intrasporangiaceae bacterium]
MTRHRLIRTTAATGCLALAVALTGCGSDEPVDPGTGTDTETTVPTGTVTPTASPSDGEEPTPTTTDDAGGGEISGVPVYYVGDSGGSFRLYREWRTVPDLGDPVESAVMAMMTVTPLDPDYSTPWVAPDELEVEREGSSITVDVSPDAFSGSVGSELSALALQQLVYTATAASTLDGPAATTVTILMDGEASDAWGHVRVGEPTTRAPQAEVFSHVWILSPAEGQEVGAGEVAISGYGTSFEANFLWRVDGPAGTEEGFTLSDNGMGFGEFEFTVDLEPGTYTVTVESTSGMGEGFVPHTDSKTFTVR